MALGAQLCEARRRMKLTASEVAAATRMKVQIVEAIEQEDFTKIAAPIYGKGFIRLYAEHVGLDPLPLVDEYMVRFVESKMPSLISEDSQLETPTPEVAAPPHAREKEETREPEADSPPEEDDLDLFSRLDRPPRTAPANKKRRGPPNVRERSLHDAWQAVAIPCRNLCTKAAETVRAKTAQLRPAPTPAPTPAEGEDEAPVPTPKSRKLPLRVASISVGAIIILIFIASVLSRCLPSPAGDSTATPPPETLRVAIEPSPPYFD